MKKINLVLILCFVVFLFSFSNKEDTTLASNDSSNIVKSLVRTTDYLRLQVNSPMKLAEYTAKKNDKSSPIKSALKDIVFIPNKGQIIDTEGKLRPDILYKAELNGVDLYLTYKGMSFVFYKYEDEPKNLAAGEKELNRIHDTFKDEIEDKIVKMYRMDLDIVGMNQNFKTVNEEQTTEYYNYYYAHCPDGITKVHAYRKVIFKSVYDNIDLVYYSNEKGLKYDFIVQPGGNEADIKLKFRNEDEVYITEEGKLRAINPLGELETDVLYTYQSNGKLIESNYIKEANGTISLNVNEYDRTKSLIIDPYIGATYYGGSDTDYGTSITTDANNNILVTGYTRSYDFPLQNPGGGAYFQIVHAGYWEDIFIMKFTSNGIRHWVTYYGGTHIDFGNSISVDGSNNILITGYTRSTDFPLFDMGGGAYFQNTGGGLYEEAHVLKFNSNGLRLWATYYGGSNMDEGKSITTDGNNNILITGKTGSRYFPLYDPGGGAYYQDSGDFYITFILKFNSNGVRQWATYYGGESWDWGNEIAIDGNNNILITGITSSSDFPLYNPGGGAYFQDSGGGYNNYDAFILKFNSNGVRQWATYYGGTDHEYGYSIATDGSNNILIVGQTWSTDLPVHNPGGGAYFQSSNGGGIDPFDAFILKFDGNGVRQWATYYGGYSTDVGRSITSDGNDNIIVTGSTISQNFPLQDPGGGAYFQNTIPGPAGDIFILKFNSVGIRYWATYYGGYSQEDSYSITTDQNNNILITGWTASTDFPLFDPGGGAYFQNSMAGNRDAFILGFRPSGAIGIQALSTKIPDEYKLYQNYPNPFNPTTKIKFDLRQSSNTKLIVYNILGKKISTLVDEKLSSGIYEVDWNGSDYPSGVYFYKLTINDFNAVKKMMLIK